MAAWTKRRQEAAESGFRTLQEMCGCRDAGSMTAAYSKWLTSSMERIAVNMNEAREQALRLVGRFIYIEGYRCLSLTRADWVVNCQSAVA